jgi:hypothetical protein
MIEQQTREIDNQRKRNGFLRGKVEDVEQENRFLKERLEEELKKRVGIHMTK